MDSLPACALASVEIQETRSRWTPASSPDLDWKTPSVHDHPAVDTLLANPQPLSGFSPATLLGWQNSHRYRWAYHDGTVIVACDPIATFRSPQWEPGEHFLQPVGPMSERTQRRLLNLLEQRRGSTYFLGVSAAFIARNPEFCSRFEIIEETAGANYIYDVQELVELPGRKFQKKRNLLAQAGRAYAWTSEPLTPANAPEAMALAEQLRAEADPDDSLAHEGRALDESLRNLECWGLEGVLVRVEGKAVAFSIFERQGEEQAVCHFEKALRECKGLYQVINNETARVLASRGFRFVNREEDMGNEGLRQAKLSYNPVRQEPAFALRFKG